MLEVHVGNSMNLHLGFLLECSKVVNLDELVGISHSHFEVISHLISSISIWCAPSSYSSRTIDSLYYVVVLSLLHKFVSTTCPF